MITTSKIECGFCGAHTGADKNRCQRCGRKFSAVSLHQTLTYPNQASMSVSLGLRMEMPEPQSDGQGQYRLFEAESRPSTFIAYEKINPRGVAEFAERRRQEAKLHGAEVPEADSGFQQLSIFPEQNYSARALMSAVEAMRFCESPIAAPLHRLISGSVDFAFIAIGYLLFLLPFFMKFGTLLPEGINTTGAYLCFGAGAVATFLAYHAVWIVFGEDTIGQQKLGVEILNFQGKRAQPWERAQRLGAGFISYCCAGLGLIWCLCDEEKLTWHDHISGTYASPRRAFAEPRTV
jgi:uncharacterized RDD family membrane protein YckC